MDYEIPLKKKDESTLYVQSSNVDLAKEEHNLLSKMDLVAIGLQKENVFGREETRVCRSINLNSTIINLKWEIFLLLV